jgi:imidazole glycerol-phosphate synthase subunit HisF
MPKIRIIPRLEVKGENVVKGICMEGLRVVGKPHDLCETYYLQGADEILFIDIVASLYNRNHLHELVSRSTEKIFLPVCVGGGVRSMDDFRALLRAGADKISINTQAVRTPEIITQASRVFGAQAVIVSIQAKRQSDGSWEVYNENGREKTDLDAVDWAEEVVRRGAGEILLTSVDRDGTRDGLDFDLIERVIDRVTVPIVVGGGVGSIQDITRAAEIGASGITVANLLHFKRTTIAEIKDAMLDQGVAVRMPMKQHDV